MPSGRHGTYTEHTTDSLFERCAPEPNTGCWLWLGGLSGVGYPLVYHSGKAQAAHRLMFRLAHGEIGKGMVICHRCDVPACINPLHLFAGSYKDNFDDMESKGRRRVAVGPAASNTKLTEEQVRAIWADIRRGDRLLDIGPRYGVSHVTISSIKCGRNWNHLKEPK